MTDLTINRFTAIVEAYGAEPNRWPEAEREAAVAFAEHNPQVAQGCLMEARQLDAMLDLGREVITPDMAEDLHYRAMARFTFAPPARVQRAPVIWASLGLAACLAGAVIGVNLSLKSLSDMRAQTVLEQTAMLDSE